MEGVLSESKACPRLFFAVLYNNYRRTVFRTYVLSIIIVNQIGKEENASANGPPEDPPPGALVVRGGPPDDEIVIVNVIVVVGETVMVVDDEEDWSGSVVEGDGLSAQELDDS